jgi:hypothetical protein
MQLYYYFTHLKHRIITDLLLTSLRMNTKFTEYKDKTPSLFILCFLLVYLLFAYLFVNSYFIYLFFIFAYSFIYLLSTITIYIFVLCLFIY